MGLAWSYCFWIVLQRGVEGVHTVVELPRALQFCSALSLSFLMTSATFSNAFMNISVSLIESPAMGMAAELVSTAM